MSEYDVNIDNDMLQYQKYFEQFPVLWEHPGVAGITLWGYIQGQIWKGDAYLVRTDGSERPAMSWLKAYVMTTSIQCNITDIAEASLNPNPGIHFYPNPVNDGRITLELEDDISELRIFDAGGRVVKKVPIYGQSRLTLELDVLSPGLYFMQYISREKLIVEKFCVE